MRLSFKQASEYVNLYEKGQFNYLSTEDKSRAEKEYKRILEELAHPLEKTDDDPNAVLVPMGYVGFTTSLSPSPRLKTFALGSCLGLVSSGKSLDGYTSGSLSHVASSLDTKGLVSKIIARHGQHGISPDEIDFGIHATGSVDKKLVAEIKRAIYNRTGQRDITEDVRIIHSTAMLYDFKTSKAFEISKINLNLSEHRKPIWIPSQHMQYEVVNDPRTEKDLIKFSPLIKFKSLQKNFQVFL